MKSKISRILGVVLTLSMLVSLALTAAPVSAGTQAWSSQSIPSATGLVLDSGNTGTGPFAISKDGKAIFAGKGTTSGVGLEGSTGATAVWSTATAHTGNNSVYLSVPDSAAYAELYFPVNIPLSSINLATTSFWAKSTAGGFIPYFIFDIPGGFGVTGAVRLRINNDAAASGPYSSWAQFVASSVTGANWQWTVFDAGWNVLAGGGFDTWTNILNLYPAYTKTVTGVLVENSAVLGSYPVSAYIDDVIVNGTTYVSEESAGRLVKSTDGGRTWTALSGVPALGGLGVITDIVCSSLDANTVYITDGVDIYKSSDGGTTWAPLSNLFGSLTLTPGLGVGQSGFIVSIDVGYLGTSPYIFAATSTFGAGKGGAYVCEEAVYGMPWTNMLIGADRVVPWAANTADVLKIKVDPVNFATTQAVMAVVTHIGGNNAITCKYGGAKWDATVNDVALSAAATLYSASLWLPSDFSATLASGKMQCLAGTAAIGGGGDVFLSVFAAPAGTDTAAFDLNIGGPTSATEVFGLSGTGAMATAAVMASGYNNATATVPVVYASKNGGLTWTPNIKGPTGNASPFTGKALSSLLVLDATTAIVGTHGADCGVSITKDFGATWNTISLVNITLTVVDDLAVGSLFMTTYTAATNESVWRFDGTNWERVFSTSIYAAPVGPVYLVESSASGGALFTMPVGGTAIWRSLDNGQIWTPIVSPVPGPIRSFVAVDAASLVVGSDANVVYTSPNSGVIWFTRACAVGTVQSMVRASNGHLLAGGTSAGAAKVARSTDVGVTWTAITASVPLGQDALDTSDVVTNVVVAFSVNYATNNTIFATGTIVPDYNPGPPATGGNDRSGVWSYNFGWTTPAWAKIDTAFTTGADVTNGVGLVSAPGGADGMVYAADAGAAGEGVSRIKYSTFASAATNLNQAEKMADSTSYTITNGLWYTVGSNVLYTLAGNVIRTYTDTLNVAGTGVAVASITTTGATVSWAALTNAATFTVVVNTTAQTNLYTAANSTGVTVTVNNTARTAAVTGLTPNTAYSVSVWGWSAAPAVSSFLFDNAAKSFTTLPSPVLAPPVNLIPNNGAINQPVSQLAFAWSTPSGGATSYNWELTTDPTFATATEGKLSTALTYLVHTGTLKYSTSYYWRVQSVTASGVSTWITSVFTTVAAPAPPVTVPPAPTPTIIVTQPQPTVIVTVIPPVVTTQPQQTVVVTVVPPVVTQTTITSVVQIPETKAPVYIWAIVAIGAVLTLAVIVLIVRTRRVV